MSLTIGKKLWLGVGTLALLLLVTSGSLIRNLRSLELNLDLITALEQPTRTAARGVTTNINSRTTASLRHVDAAETVSREQLRRDQTALETFSADYGRLAGGDKPIMAAKIGSLSRTYSALGDSIVAIKDRQKALLDRARENFSQMDEIVGGELIPHVDRSGEAGYRKIAVAAEMMTHVRELGTWLQDDVLTERSEFTELFFREDEELRRDLAVFEQLDLTHQERRWTTNLRDLQLSTDSLVEETLALNDSVRLSGNRLFELRAEVDGLMEEALQVWPGSDIDASDAMALRTLRTVRVTLLVTLGITVLLGAGTIAGLGRATHRFRKRLTEAADRIESGAPDHKIELRTADELGELALAFNDMVERHEEAEQALRESEQRYALAARAVNEGLWDWDLKTDEVYFSPRWQTMLGLEAGEIGKSPGEWFNRVHPEDLPKVRADITAHLSDAVPHYENEHRILHQDGSYHWFLSRGLAVRDDAGKASRIVGSLTDVTERRLTADKLVHQAFHDALLDVPNRALFMDRLEVSIARRTRQADYHFAVLFLDLDDFKIVNDTRGHRTGDQLLAALVQRLNTCVRPGDTVGRMGGDEFAILLDDVRDLSGATRVAERIEAQLARPFQLGEHEVLTSASIGIVSSESGYEAAEDFLRDADVAMYRAKALGKRRHEIFDGRMPSQVAALRPTQRAQRACAQRARGRSQRPRPARAVAPATIATKPRVVRGAASNGAPRPAGSKANGASAPEWERQRPSVRDNGACVPH